MNLRIFSATIELAAQKYLVALGDYLIAFLKKYWSVLYCDLAENPPKKYFSNIFYLITESKIANTIAHQKSI
jgi:hypothetical protein